MSYESTAGFQIAQKLADAVREMLPIARKLGDATTGRSLARREARMRQGLVRVALIGATSSGKSTVVNALVRHLVVPENPNVSSPIPVWVSYRDGGAPRAEVYERAADGSAVRATSFPLPEFQRKYCYNVNDIADHDRVRFQRVDYAAIGVESDFLAGGAVLIDTLGISATAQDTSKTYAVLNEGVDLVIFVTQNNNLHLDEIAFLREAVLGYEPEKRAVNYPVAPQNLIILYNNHSMLPPQVSGFHNSLRPLFEGHEQGAAARAWAADNVFFIQGLYARMGRCGAYPYFERAPEGSGEKDALALKKREEKEEKVRLAFGDASELVEESQIAEFEQALAGHVKRRASGANSAAVRRADELLTDLDAMCESANQRIEASQLDLNQLRLLEADLKAHLSANSQARGEIRSAMRALRDDYLKGVKAVFESSAALPMLTNCMEEIGRMQMPEALALDFQYAQFKALSCEEKIEALRPYIAQVVDLAFPICRDAVLQGLNRAQTGSGVPAPREVLEASRGYIVRQAEALNTRIRALQALGGQKTGMMLPGPRTVEAVFVEFQTNLEQSILDAVSAGVASGEKWFQEHQALFIGQLKGNIIQWLLPAFMSPKMFWALLKEKLFMPLVKLLAVSVSNIADRDNPAGLHPAVSASYEAACDRITDTYVQIVSSIKESLARGEKIIAGERQAAEQIAQDMNGVKADCLSLKDRLLMYRAELLESRD